MLKQMEAIDKLRALINWANYQSEEFNQKFISISDIVVSEVCLLLGYSIF